MKNLLFKIKLLTFSGAFVLCQDIKSQETNQYKDPQDFLKVGFGFQTWDKIKPYKNFSYFNLGFEKILTKNASLEGGFDYGSQKERIDGKRNELTRLSIGIGLKRNFLISDDRKFLFYINGGAEYILISSEQLKNKDPALGFYYGGGIENILNSSTLMFLEAGINKAEIRTETDKLDVGGPKLDLGIKKFFPEAKKKEF